MDILQHIKHNKMNLMPRKTCFNIYIMHCNFNCKNDLTSNNGVLIAPVSFIAQDIYIYYHNCRGKRKSFIWRNRDIFCLQDMSMFWFSVSSIQFQWTHYILLESYILLQGVPKKCSLVRWVKIGFFGIYHISPWILWGGIDKLWVH